MEKIGRSLRLLLLLGAIAVTAAGFYPGSVDADHCGKHCPGGTEPCVGPHGQICGAPDDPVIE